MRKRDLTGMKFGRLSVIEYAGSNGKRSMWSCQCSCGNSALVQSDKLVCGKVVSCGCRKREASLENCARNAIKPRHGMTGSSEHKIWSGMIERCTRDLPRHAAYFGRGIKVCERWMTFENFYSDMGPRPSPLHSIDRINNDGNYEPENCRWELSKAQNRNRRRTRYVLVDGKKMPLMALAEQIGAKKNAAQYFFSFLKLVEEKYSTISTA